MKDIMTIRSKPRWFELHESAISWLEEVKGADGRDQKSRAFAADYADACMTNFPAPSLREFWSQWPDWQPQEYWAGQGFNTLNNESAPLTGKEGKE